MRRRPPIVNTRYRSWGGGALLGIGVMAGVDEIVFHQILGWHHFYDLSTPAIGLLSDGLLHAAELVALVAGFFTLLEANTHQVLRRDHAWAGFFLGAGGFQLFDGTVNHKLLRLHQIRYDVPILPYDLAWNFSALVLIAIGCIIYRQSRTTRISPNPRDL